VIEDCVVARSKSPCWQTIPFAFSRAPQHVLPQVEEKQSLHSPSLSKDMQLYNNIILLLVGTFALCCSNAAKVPTRSEFGLRSRQPVSIQPRGLQASNQTAAFRMGTADVLLPYAEDLTASIPTLATEGQTVALRAWATTPAVEFDIAATLTVDVVAATNDSQLGPATVYPTVQYIASYPTQALADQAIANGSWSDAPDEFGSNARYVEFYIMLPNDFVATGKLHTVLLTVSGMGSINGTYDGVTSNFIFNMIDDDTDFAVAALVVQGSSQDAAMMANVSTNAGDSDVAALVAMQAPTYTVEVYESELASGLLSVELQLVVVNVFALSSDGMSELKVVTSVMPGLIMFADSTQSSIRSVALLVLF